MSLSIRFAIFGGIAAATLAGCGSPPDEGPTTIVKGRITDKGKPLKLDPSKIPLPKGATAPPPGMENGGLRIVFVPVKGQEQYQATYNVETGEFEVPGPHKKGIAFGEYKVVITAGYSNVRKGDESGDYFGGKFSRDNTPLRCQVKPDEEVNLDISKPKG